MVELRLYTAVTAVRFCHEVPEIRVVSSVGRAGRCQRPGRRFEPCTPHQRFNADWANGFSVDSATVNILGFKSPDLLYTLKEIKCHALVQKKQQI